MAKKNITIEFPEEKMNVLQFFLDREQQKLETLLEEQLEKLYTKMVPKPTRDFIQYQMTGEVPVDSEETNETSREAAKEEKRAARRSKKQEQQMAQADTKQPAQADTPLEQDSQEEESGGMQMSM